LFLLPACSSGPAIDRPQPAAVASPGGQMTTAVAQPEVIAAKAQPNQDTKPLNRKLMERAQLEVDPGESLLGPGDLLHVEVLEAQELSTKARISARGFVTLPLLGQLKIDGMTAREAETHIEDLYRKKYIKDPHISVFVEEHVSQRVALAGQFKNPGTYDLGPRRELFDVMALGGGLTEHASTIVQIRRGPETPDSDGEEGAQGKDVIFVDIEELLAGGKSESNIQIKGGDTIFVAHVGEYFLDGAVRRPGAFFLRQKMTIKEAILAAGGLAPWADDDDVSVVRVEGNERKKHMFDMSKMENWGFPIQNQDVVIVGSNPFLRVWYGFSFGFMGTGYRDPGQ
jgi:polysaccharide export outer membrane protein